MGGKAVWQGCSPDCSGYGLPEGAVGGDLRE